MENPEQVEFKSTYSRSMPLLLDMLGVSLVVSTYQAGRVVVCSARGGKIHTHYVALDRPMGIALSPDGNRLAIGTNRTVVIFHNMPKLASEMGRDACYAPRTIHVTGLVDGHDMAYAGDALWQVNTRFSCLATIEQGVSFHPRWKPFWISLLVPEDRCHLNGMAVSGDKPAYVTTVAHTDDMSGWREFKRAGGAIVDVRSGLVVGRRLSMPHSPRVHDGHLYFLESGEGGLNRYNPDAPPDDCHLPIAHLPGFTRGLDFAGRVAFVGLSRVRETATFGELPITTRPQARECGIYAIDIDTGRTLGHISFDESVSELFAVAVLPWRSPTIMEWDDPQTARVYALPERGLEHPLPSMIR